MRRQRMTLSMAIVALVVGLGSSACNTLTPVAASGAVPLRVQEPRSVTSAPRVSLRGNIVPKRQADLNFATSGRVAQLLVTEGQMVRAGQEIARLEAPELESGLDRARAGLKAAQAQSAKAKAQVRPEEIALAETALATAKADVKAAKIEVDVQRNQLASVEAERDSADKAVVIAQANLAASQAEQTSAQAGLEKLKAGPSQETVATADKQIELAKNELYALQTQRDASRSSMEGSLAAAQNRVEIAQLQRDQLVAAPRAEDAKIAQAHLAQATAAVGAASGELAQAQTRAAQAQAAVKKAESEVALAEADAESVSTKADQAVAQVNLMKAGPRSEDVAIAEAAVAEAEAYVVEAQNKLAQAVLKAPFDGLVGTVMIHEGEFATPQSVVLRLGDPGQLQVQVRDVNEKDVGVIRVGQEASVRADGLPGESFKAHVSAASLRAVDQDGSGQFSVMLDMDPSNSKGLFWGMSVLADIAMP